MDGCSLMCEILLRVVDKTNVNLDLSANLLKRGDVVVVREDGWAWGKEELRNPDWRIIKIPGVAALFAEPFLGPELASEPTDATRLRKRAFSFDMQNQSLPTAFKSWLADSNRTLSAYSIPLTIQMLSALKKAKAR